MCMSPPVLELEEEELGRHDVGDGVIDLARHHDYPLGEKLLVGLEALAAPTPVVRAG